MANQAPQRSISTKINLINKKLLPGNLSSNDSKKGIRQIQIEDKELDNITNLFENWNQEVELRRKEILEWDQKKFTRRMIAKLRPGIVPETVSGQELAKWYPLKSVQKQVKWLLNHPKDVMARLKLVSLIGKSSRDFSTEVYRALLLQALVACSLGEFHTVGLQIALQAQDTYFSKLLNACRWNARKLQTYLSNQSPGGSELKQNRKLMIKRTQEILKSMQIITSYQRYTEKVIEETNSYAAGLRETDSPPLGILRLDDLKNLLIKEEPSLSKEKQLEIIKEVRMAVQLMRYLPVLHPIANELITVVIQLMPDYPIGYFFKARISKNALIFVVGRYEAGERTKKTQKQIQDAFKDTYHHYAIAADKVGRTAKTPLEFTILTEYASIIHYFYRVSINVLGIALPDKWLKSVFLKAHKTLAMTAGSKKSEIFQRDLEKDWADAGFDPMKLYELSGR